MKWYNIELKEKTELKEFLQVNNIEFEISKAGDLYHFEILLDKDSIVFQTDNLSISEWSWYSIYRG